MPDGPKQIRPVKFGLAGKYLYMMRSKDTWVEMQVMFACIHRYNVSLGLIYRQLFRRFSEGNSEEINLRWHFSLYFLTVLFLLSWKYSISSAHNFKIYGIRKTAISEYLSAQMLPWKKAKRRTKLNTASSHKNVVSDKEMILVICSELIKTYQWDGEHNLYSWVRDI